MISFKNAFLTTYWILDYHNTVLLLNKKKIKQKDEKLTEIIHILEISKISSVRSTEWTGEMSEQEKNNQKFEKNTLHSR